MHARSWISGAFGALIALAGVVAAPVAEAAGDETQITVKPEDCRRLVAHRPADDVAYKPGVDVDGNAVAPADLPGSAIIKAPDKITFNVTYDLLNNYGVDEDSPLSPRGEASVGTVKYDLLTGRLEFNGQPLGDAEQRALAAACAAAERSK